MIQYKYPVQETINGITLIYNGPDVAPLSDPKARSTKEGDLEDYFLWKNGDASPATHVVMDVDIGEQKIKILTRQSKQNWWKYRIFVTGDSNQMFQRKDRDGQWSDLEPVTNLRIKLTGEADTPAIDSIAISNNNARIEHQGSDCSLVWNPATRKYKLVCP